MTLDGKLIARSLLASRTLSPLDGAAAVNDRLQEVLPAPVNELARHESEPMPTVPAPGASATSEMEAENTLLPCVAVIFAVWLALTAAAFAANVVLVAPAATVTVDGTVSAGLLLAKETTKPPVGAAISVVTVQVSVPDPVICTLAQLNPVSAAVWPDFVPLPCSWTVRTGVVEVLVINVSLAVESTASLGLKCTLRLRLLPVARFTGSAPWPSTVNEGSEVASCAIATDADPVFDTVSF